MPKRGSLYLKFTCMFMIYLLIMPVLHSANVFAEFFGDIHGYDGVTGFRKVSGDITIINVSASIPGEAISPSQVKLISDPTRPFECSPPNASVPALCEMKIPGELPPGPHLYEVQLFGSDGSEASAKIPLTIYADNLAPEIHHFDLERNGSDVVAAYQVSDQACDGCGPEVCAGVDRIVFLLNYVEVGSVFPETDECLLQPNTTALQIEPTGGVTTTKTICLDAYDHLDQKSSECMDIVMDFSPPQLINASLWLGDFPVKYTKGEPIGNARLQAFISEGSELDVDSVVADFSALTARPEFKEVYRNIDMSEQYQELFSPQCRNVSEGLYECTWEDLLVILPAGVVPEIRISALDNLSNRMNSSYTLPIDFDNTPPQVTAIRTGIADDRGRYWVGTGNNTILVDVTDEGSGFSDRKLFLDVSSFGTQQNYEGKTLLMPLNCSLGWTCTYPFVNVVTPHSSGQALPVSLSIGSADDAGNAAEGATSTGLYFDAEAPQIMGVQNSSICPTAPDSIDITVNVSERYSGGVRAYVDAPELSSNYFPMEFDCEEGEIAGVWTCDISIDNLVSYYVDGTINLTLEDRAGNRNTTTLHQEVCEAAPGTPPNIVRTVSSVNLFPRAGIDRQVAGVSPFPLFWQPNPGFDAGNGQIQDIKIDSCSFEEGEASDVYIVTPLNKYNPIFGMKLSMTEGLSVKNASRMKESVEMSCQLSMIVRAGTKVYQEPEIENVIFDVPLYDTLFGELNKTMERKMRDIENAISRKESQIKDKEDSINWYLWWCSISEFVMKLMMVLQVLKIALYALGWIVYAVVEAFGGDGDQMGGNIYYLPCYISDLLTTTFVTNLWQVDSTPMVAVKSPGYLNKILCSLATCRFTEVTNFIELFGYMGRTDSGTFSGSVDGVNREGERNSVSRENINVDVDRGDVWASIIVPGDNKFSAYRSYPIAKRTLCMPAQIYGLKKERQILCMYRNCYRDLVSAGFSPEICDRMYAGRECLYVDGAAYRIVKDAQWNKLFSGIIEWLMNQIVTTGLSLGLRLGLDCGYPVGLDDISDAYETDKEYCGDEASTALEEGWQALLCGTGIMLAMWTDIGDWMDWDDARNMYEQTLGDPDFCEM